MNQRTKTSLLILTTLLATVLSVPTARGADVLDQIRKEKRLLWGGDQEGGGPYIYPREDNPAEVTGFEVELAARLAEHLQVRPEFSQGQWDKQPDLLRTGKIHIIINGYEFTPERAAFMDASIPYYIYDLQLLARTDDNTIRSWDDLKSPRAGRKLKVGVLIASAADTYATNFCGDDCEVVRYDGSTDAMREVETTKLAATVQDGPIASFYGPRFSKLRNVGDPVAPGYYVMYVRKGESALLKAVNQAIISMARKGDLERIYRKYAIWNDRQTQIAEIADSGKFYGYESVAAAVDGRPSVSGAIAISDDQGRISTRAVGWGIVRRYSGILLQSAGLTVVLSVLSFPIAIFVGLAVAIGRLYGPRVLRVPLAFYVEFLRGTPLMLQLYFVFFFLPEIGITIPAFWTAIAGLAINYSAYESEIYRAGLQAIPAGQMEAALSLGMSRPVAIRRILVPQAFRIVIPPVVNDFIALFKDTSVCSVVTLVELTKRFSILSLSTQATIELMLMTGFLYLAMSYPMSVLSRRVEKRLGLEPSL
jgi:polar amino acid transport system substrate-binding protein